MEVKDTVKYPTIQSLKDDARKAGIKEVVEWLSEHWEKDGCSLRHIKILRAEWQAQRKEWGIE